MATPSWRKWFSRYTHAASFALRGFFALLVAVFSFVVSFVFHIAKDIDRRFGKILRPFYRITTLLISRGEKFIRAILQHPVTKFVFAVSRELSHIVFAFYRKHRRGTLITSSILVFAFIGLSVFFSMTARAEKVVHAYISPSVVSGEGVENPDAAAVQDLSIDARFADFALDYSARFAFGAYADVARSLPVDPTASSSATSTLASGAPVVNDASTSSTMSTADSSTTLVATGTTASTSSVTSTDTSSTTTETAIPSIFDTMQSVVHAVLPGLVPAPTIDLTTPSASDLTPTTSVEQESAPVPSPATIPGASATSTSEVQTFASSTSAIIRSTLARFFAPKVALALDVATPTAQVSSPLLAPITTPVVSNAVAAASDTQANVSPAESSSTPPAAIPAADSAGTSTSGVLPSATSAASPSEDRDPYKVASCTLEGKDCHLLVMEGFGVGPELSKYPVRNAQLMVSLAGRAAPQDIPDRVIFRAYRNGHWDYLGEQAVSGEFDNSSRGGFLSFPLNIQSWSELANMTVAVEYLREGTGDASVLLDAAWVDVGFAADEAPDDLALLSPNVKSALMARDAEERIRERDHLKLDDGTVLNFTNLLAQTPGAKLRVALTNDQHAVLGSGEEYISVTNIGKNAEKVRLSFHFPEEGGRVTDIAQYSHNVPHNVVEARTAPIAYVCASGWQQASSTDEIIADKSYSCADGNTETHVCTSLSDDKTSCLAEVTAVGQQEDTVYRRDFVPDAVFSGSFRDNEGIFGRAMDALLSEMPSDIMPTSVREVSYTNPFDVEPGATHYFRVDYQTPINTRGDIYVEAVAASGAYGLGHAEFDGSWNWRMPIDVSLPYAQNSDELAVPVSLDKMPLEFWKHVKKDGSDIRFTDEDATIELPYWIAEFDAANHHGFIWVRLPAGGGILPRIYIYAGNPDAVSSSKPWGPFMTSVATPRAVLIGKSGDEADVTVTALAPQVHVQLDGHDERTLLYGETALFEHVTNAAVIRATGPIAAKAHSVFARATIAPLGYAGLQVALKEDALELAVVPATSERGDMLIGSQHIDLATSSVFRTPLDGEHLATTSAPALFLTEDKVKASLLVPDTDDNRDQLASSVVLDDRANAVRVSCDGSRVFGAFDARGSLLATSTCGVSLNGPFDEGTLIRMLNDETGITTGARFYASNGFDTEILDRDTASRLADSFGEELAFGEPEYVLPGEHRLFDRLGDKERSHVNRFLSAKREFSAEEIPSFHFQYKPQSSGFFRTLRAMVGLAPFTVDNVSVEQGGKKLDIDTVVEYGKNNEWTVRLSKDAKNRVSPGKLTLTMQIHEGTATYEDSYDFYWALLAVNFNKATYEKGETANISLGALSDTGNTICNAKLKLFVTTPASTTVEVPVTPSGKCDGNNIVDVPDYSASYTPVDEGKYDVRLVRLDDAENILADVHDSFTVVPHMTYVIERIGPTRINPIAPYDMTLRVFARESYKGKLSELIPADFEITERGGGTLEWVDAAHSGKRLNWDVDMQAGQVYQFTYRFDAPDISPYIFFLGPATIGDGDTAYTEPRTWQIASDAAGKMIIYWTDALSVPAGWDLMSSSTGPFYDRWAMGSSTYGVTGGAATHTHTFTTSVSSAIYTTAVPSNGTTNFLSYKDHTHAFTPTFGVGSNIPQSLSVRVLRSQTAGEVPLPAGAAVLFESVPSSGWTTLTGMEGYYPYGDNSIGTATGTATHTHSVSGTLGAPTGGPTYARSTSGTYPLVATISHTHTLVSTSTPPVSNDPPFVTYRLAKSNAAGPVPNDAITMWDADPAAGWVNLSTDGGILSNRFVRIDTSAGATGGHATHNHPDLLGIPTSVAAGTARANIASGSLFGANPNHTHTVDLASFSTSNNLPPYITVVFAKRAVGVPVFKQIDYRFYDNVNDVTPIDPWPAGAVDIAENMPVDDSTYRIHPGSVFRVRVDANIQNATTTAGTYPLKLQYSTDGACASALNWNDVGAPGSATPLRGYTNNLVSEGAALPSALLSTTTPSGQQAYRDSSGSVNFLHDATPGANTEWDWALEAGPTLASSTRYCLRMVESSGKVFGAYDKYPNFLSNNAPQAPVPSAPFNNAKLGTTTPSFTFSAADAESNNEHYEIQIDTDPNFGAPFVNLSTMNSASSFTNVNNPANRAPYTPGDTIKFTVPVAKALSNNTTYWWRVHAKDPTGSTQYGDWSVPQSFTIDTTLTTSAWYQTTNAQFAQDESSGLTISGNTVNLASGSTTGTIVSQQLDFAAGPLGTVWGSLAFTKDAGTGITFQIEYLDNSGNWSLIPDSLVPGNSTGLSVSGTSLKAIDPQTYPSLRVRANFTNSGTPVLTNWTIYWAFKTLAPVITMPFSHASAASTTPFIFAATDPLNYSIRYWFSYSTDPTFTASTTCYSDTQTPTAPACGTFTDTTSGGAAPFASGHVIKFTPNPVLTSGTTYYYRIAAYGVGGGAWSFWSDTRSFTAQAAAPAYTTWFQTMAGQFNMDTLSGSFANGANSVAVATTSDRVLMVYGSGSNPNPKYRFYEAGTLGGEGNALSINSTVLWTAAKASPVNDQYMLGTMGADHAIKFQVFENGIWSRMFTMSASGPSATRRSFDVAYETLSGHALAVSCNGNNASYAVFDGSSWGTEQSLTLPFTTNCELVKMATNPTKNEIIALFRNTGSSYSAAVWDGTQWPSAKAFTFSASAGVVEPAHDAMAIEYEKSSGKAVALVGNNTSNGFRYRVWGGSNWTGTETAFTRLGTGQAVAKLAWGNLRQDPASNDLLLCDISQFSATDDGAWTDYVRFINEVPQTTVVEGEYWPYSRHAQSNDCAYETKTGRTGRAMTVSDESWAIADGSSSNNHTVWDALNVAARTWQSGSTSYTNQLWTYSGTTYQWSGIQAWTTLLQRASLSGDVLAMVLTQNPTLRYMFSVWNGTSWTTPTNIATPSVTTKPYGNPFDLAPQTGLSSGRVFSSAINFADGQSPAWRQARFTTSVPGGSTALISVEYLDGTGNWSRVPDTDLPGNSIGTSTSPIDLSNLNVGTYSTIRLRADLQCNTLVNCPTLNDWTVDWAQGLAVSGIARDNNRTTPVTSGTVKVAVNGVEQLGKTGTIDALGNWTIPGVSYRNGDVVTAWIDNPGSANRAVAVARFMGAGSLDNMELSRRWLAVGDSSQPGETIANSDLALFDNNNEVATIRPDIFFNVDASQNLNVNSSAASIPDASLVVATGTIWRPKSTGIVTNTMYSHIIYGETNADGNIIKVAGNWRNSGTFTPGTGLTMFNATSSVHTIDNTGAAQYKFNDVTFGEIATTATWQTVTPLYTNGILTINYGTLSPGTQPVSIEDSLAIGASGIFTKGTATTTFLGVAAANWSDLSSGQDMGNVVVDGSPKNLTLSSGVRATNIWINTGDALYFGVNTLTLSGNFKNDGTVSGGTGKLVMAPAGAATIKQGSSSLPNVTLQSGSVSWVDTNATTTGDVLVSGGTQTFPTATLTVGGGFTQTGGTFVAPNLLTMNGASANKTMSAISSFKNLTFSGTGSWGFATAATTTGNVIVSGGVLTLPASTLTVGGNFLVTANLMSNSGTLFMNGGAQSITTNGEILAGVTAGGTTLTFADTNATTTGSVIVNAGSTLNLPTSGSLTVGGSFINNGTANANASLLTMNRSAGAATLAAGTMVLSSVAISGGGTFSVNGNTHASANFTLGSVGGFTMQSGFELRVDGFFSNQSANANTTWTGSTLHLTSGATMSLNTKTLGGDDYGTITLDGATQVRMWNSSATSVTTNATSGLYGQNWAGIGGALRIYGTYAQNNGTAWWDYATDFDGTVLGVPRAVTVQLASGATANFASGTALEVLGGIDASTTVASLAGTYNLNLATTTLSAQYAVFSGLGAAGIAITGSSSIAKFDDVDLSVGVNSGYIMTLAKQVIDANAGKQFMRDFFRSGGFTATQNVHVTTASTNYIRFRQHGGNIAGESFDNDPSGNPGEVRWDDSNYLINISGNVYSDAGVTPMGSPVCDNVTSNVRVQVTGGGSFGGTCNPATGAFTVNNVSFTGETTMSIYLKGVSAKAVTVTRSAATNLTGIKLYQNRIILTHEDVLPMTIAALSGFDADNDADMLFTANAGTLAIPAAYELWIWNGKTFTPGGNVTTGTGSANVYGGALHLDNNATMNALSNEQFSIGGRLQTDSGATLNAASSTLVMTATDARTIATVNPLSLWNLSFTGAGSWSLGSDIVVANTANLAAGTLSGTGNITAKSGMTGNGTLAMTGGTLSLPFGGSLGGVNPWTAFNLTLGDGSTAATTTKAGAGTTTVANVLTVKTAHYFDLAANPLVLSGAGSPLVAQGGINTSGGTITYASAGATAVTNIAYNNLSFLGTGTYTLPNLSLSISGNFLVGGGATTPTVTGLSNDPVMSIGGNVAIAGGATYIASDAATTTIKGNWTNAGTFTNSLGILQFIGSGSKIITPGNSPFGRVDFNDSLGSWTIAGNATASVMSISSSTSWTLASGKTLEITSDFKNLVGSPITTWTGSTLYLNTGNRVQVNSKTSGADTYNILKLGANTQAILWNSSSTQMITPSGSGVLSQNHAGINGNLYIFGDYKNANQAEYWDYAKDFDGAILGTPRAVNVRFAANATALYSGSSIIEMIGNPTASTTVRAQSGSYGLTIAGASTSMQYLDISDANATGTALQGSVKIGVLNDVVFRNPSGVGSMMTVAASVITANPLKNLYRLGFIAPAGNNVTATGVTASAWRFVNHYGGRDGELYDVDPAGDPGYLIWDNSAAQITISGHVYKSDGVTVSSACNGVSQFILLKVQGAGTLKSACSATDGSYSISPVVYANGDTLAVYASSTSGIKAVAYAYNPMTNIADMDLYENTVIVRNEQAAPIATTNVDSYDKDQDANIPVRVTAGVMTLDANTKLVVWDNKSFAPVYAVSVPGNTGLSAIDGDVEIRPGASWVTNGTDIYTIGGDFSMGANAQIIGSGGVFNFTSTVAGKSISAATPATLTNMTFNGSGSWAISGVATTTGNVNITTGTVTLPATTFAVGGNFNNQGTFNANNGALLMTATSTGMQIRTNGSAFKDLAFLGTGAWSFLDNATTTGNFTIASGTPTLPSGTLAVNGDFQNIGGAFVANGGTLSMTGSGSRLVVPGGSAFNNLRIANGTFVTNVQNATAMGDVYINSGSLTLPVANFSVGGTFKNSGGAFTAGATSTVIMTATSTGKLINPGSSLFTNLLINGAGGGFTIEANATTSGTFTLQNASAFVQSPSTRLVVQDTFTNKIGGTWTGSTLRIEKQGSSVMNAKADGAAVYNNLELGTNAQVSSWKSSFANVVTASGAALYSQNDANVNGALKIYGNYVRSSGNDYWSATTDFDGSPIASRSVSVRFAGGSSGTWNSGAGLYAVGTSGAITSIQSLSGTYGLTIQNGVFEGRYIKLRNTTTSGLQLMGTSTSIVALENSDLATGVDGGNILSIDGTVVDANAGAIFPNNNFATDTGQTTGTNAYLNGTSTNAITFSGATGGIAGEAFDNDGGHPCGAFRWDDSSCQFVDERYYRWRNDDGGEAVPDNEWYGNATSSWTYRERVHVTNPTTSAATNIAVKVVLPYQSQMQADYRDIRFTSSDGVSLVPYWIEKYTSTNAYVWVKVPTLGANGSADLYVYYGNSAATSASNGKNVFNYFYDAESGLGGMTGDTASFRTDTEPSLPPTYSTFGTKYLDASNQTGFTTGLASTTANIPHGMTIRELLYLDPTTYSDDACITFGVGSPISKNWAYCVSPQRTTDSMRLVKDAIKDGYDVLSGDISAQVASVNNPLTTAGWYNARIDWETSGKITAALTKYDGTPVTSITATDGYAPGSGIGFTYWYQHGGWDNVTATPFISGDPTVNVLPPQQHGGASWITSENTAFGAAQQNTNLRLRFGIRNTGTPLTNQQLELDYAIKGGATNCESVPDVNYIAVPTISSCAGSGVCMATSSRYANGISTTPLLSTPGPLSFVSGRMIEDPSNITSGLDIAQNYYTEVEYALQFTPNATQPTYCMRVSNNGTRLVSYTKVAEVSVSHPPKISNWNWTTPTLSLINEGGTTTVMATGTVTDYSGFADISTTATGTIYRKSLGENCTANDNNCYTPAKTQCSLSSCAGISCTLTCKADLQYFAEPTDVGAFAGDMWTSSVHVHNQANVFDSAYADATLNTLKALSVTSGTVDFGSLEVGTTSPAYNNPTTTLQNTGNAQFTTGISGTDLTATGSTIPAINEKVATSTFDYTACTLCTALSTSTPATVSLTLPKPNSTTPVLGNLYFGIYIPFNTKPLLHNGSITLYAQ